MWSPTLMTASASMFASTVMRCGVTKEEYIHMRLLEAQRDEYMAERNAYEKLVEFMLNGLLSMPNQSKRVLDLIHLAEKEVYRIETHGGGVYT